jgi:hypothetical protein
MNTYISIQGYSVLARFVSVPVIPACGNITKRLVAMIRTSLWALALPGLVSGFPAKGHEPKPPAFFLAGDSTTAVDGGWGDGLLAPLISPAWGVNIGKSGATTVSFEAGGYWTNVTDHVRDYAKEYDVYVTISVRLLGKENGAC